MDTESRLSTNSIAFMALCNEYCHALENAREAERSEFIREMLRLLPRIYISASDLSLNENDDLFAEETYIDGALDEDYYESVRRAVEALLGEDDMYLEVFEDDMKYSDTPIAASVSEALADLFQAFYNFLSAVRDTTDAHTLLILQVMREDFESYWSRILCNVMRPLNQIRYTVSADEQF